MSDNADVSVSEMKTKENNAFSTPKSVISTYRKLIIKTAKSYHIEPELLAGVVFVETYGGGVSGWFEFKNRLSLTKQFLMGNATIGITQVSPENIKDFQMVILYNQDILWQLNQGAGQLASIRDLIYPNTPKLNEERIAQILRFYNQGTEFNLIDYPNNEITARYALAFYKKNLRIRNRVRENKENPFYSYEITQFNEDNKNVEIYVFGVKVAECKIKGNIKRANNYAYTAYLNRERINKWLYNK